MVSANEAQGVRGEAGGCGRKDKDVTGPVQSGMMAIILIGQCEGSEMRSTAHPLWSIQSKEGR